MTLFLKRIQMNFKENLINIKTVPKYFPINYYNESVNFHRACIDCTPNSNVTSNDNIHSNNKIILFHFLFFKGLLCW
jgi:hypothetical protein